MTPHMHAFVRSVVWHVGSGIRGTVLEIGSYVEQSQGHLDMRLAFPPGTRYMGVDVLEGPGVDRRVDLFDERALNAVVEEIDAKVILCLYVVEHVWDIVGAVKILGRIWQRRPETWLWVATHQNQPFHGTDQYPDYWRMTAAGLSRLMDEAGVPGAKVFVVPDTSNPKDVLAIRQPLSMSWPGEALSKTVERVGIYEETPTHWEQFC